MSDISTKSQELAKQLWAIANDLRGSMDSSNSRIIFSVLSFIAFCLSVQRNI